MTRVVLVLIALLLLGSFRIAYSDALECRLTQLTRAGNIVVTLQAPSGTWQITTKYAFEGYLENVLCEAEIISTNPILVTVKYPIIGLDVTLDDDHILEFRLTRS